MGQSANPFEEKARIEGRAVAGDLSSAEIGQLVCLYDAAATASWSWQGGQNMPRSGYEGGDERVPDLLGAEVSRCDYIARAVVEELFRRHPDDLSEAAERVRVLIDHYGNSGAEDSQLYNEALLGLAGAAPKATASTKRAA